MKTILYNPIFINPQAYYVFPQLYDIEKGDSFIEPAVYSGYLIIENLISNTSSQVINTKEVDFTEFAGKRIKISQYTNIGAVVLGEWNIPEDMSGPSFHKSLVDAWFMSGLSNGDKPTSITGVKGNEIQLKNFAYALGSGFGKYDTDFNSWKKENTNIDVTSSSITITGALEINTLITYKNEISKEWKVEITGLPASKSIFYRYYEDSSDYKQYEMNKNGIYLLPPSKVLGTIAFICNSSDIDKLTNLTITQLPSAYEGALVFDGIDDYAYVDNFDTLIDGDEFTTIGYYEVIPQGNKSSYNLYARSTGIGWSRIETPSIKSNLAGMRNYTVNFTSKTYSYNVQEGESFQIDTGYKSFPKKFNLNGWYNEEGSSFLDFSKVAHYWVAIYKGKLTPEEIETEKERLNEEWLKRKTE